MSTKCAYYKCDNTSLDVSMFRFPVKDKDRLKLWIQNSGNTFLDSLTDNQLSRRYICSAHFPEASIHCGARNRLIGPAVPVHFQCAGIQEHSSATTSPHVEIETGVDDLYPEVLKVKTPTKFYRIREETPSPNRNATRCPTPSSIGHFVSVAVSPFEIPSVVTMASEFSNASPKYVCMGCLSTDRKLRTIYDVVYKQIFEELLNSMGQVKQELLLCWECAAIVKSVIRFKQQVKTAHSCLLRYMVNQTTNLACLSNLTSTICNTTEDYYHSAVDDKSTIATDQKPTDSFHFEISDIRSKFTDPSGIDTVNSSNCDGGDLSSKQRETQPVFVKIEDNDFDFGEQFYEDENVADDDKETETEPKIEDSQELCKKSKSKKKKRTKVKYDESDDEPLRPSKKEKREPKQEDTDDNLAEKPRGKKEKAAGVVSNSRVSRNLEQLNVAEGQIEMVVLSWEEVEAERQKALTSVVFTRHDYRCYDCVLGFNHRFKLENHMNKHAPSAGPAECPVCRVRCRDAHALVAHKRRHRVRWRCVACGEASSRAAVAADHAARAHGAAPTHTCRRCGLTLASLAKLRNHMKNHAERQKCELCGKTFRDRTSLRTHLFIHRGEKEYSCPHCGKKFLFKKAMEVHLVTHSAPAQLYCLECDMTFKNRMSFYQHKKYNLKHIDPAKLKYECPLCDKKFLKAVRLEEHNYAVHLKVTPIRCTMQDCDFACSSRPVLRTHINMIHRNRRAVRNHVCDTCGKAYTTKKTLEGHMRSHTGERPFRCALCPSTFAYEAALYNHGKLVHRKGKVGRRGGPTPGPGWPAPDAPAPLTHTS